MRDLIAFTGLSGVGKDEASKPLLALGYKRHAFGNIIKHQLDELIQKHFGFSAFTEDRTQKAKIRRTLEHWGEDNYDAILDEFMATLPEKAVNTRLVRVKEAAKWVGKGGIIVEVVRPGLEPATQWEVDRMQELTASGLIRCTVINSGTPQDLHAEILRISS